MNLHWQFPKRSSLAFGRFSSRERNGAKIENKKKLNIQSYHKYFSNWTIFLHCLNEKRRGLIKIKVYLVSYRKSLPESFNTEISK